MAGKDSIIGEQAESADFDEDEDFKFPKRMRTSLVSPIKTLKAGSFIYVLLEDGSESVAYIESLSEKKQEMSVRWFYTAKELQIKIPPPVAHMKEVFISETCQNLSLKCFNGSAHVLSWGHYRQFKEWELSQGHQGERVQVCRRGFYAVTSIQEYNIENLQGYWDQEILTRAGINKDNEASNSKMQPRRQSGRFLRSGKITKVSDYTTGDGIESSRKTFRTSGNEFAIDTEVEVLCEDPPELMGCWFRCRVVEINADKLKLQCWDSKAKEKLDGWQSPSRVTTGVNEFRSVERKSIRPLHPRTDVSLQHEPGTAVDVWDQDCWVEGVLKHCYRSKKAAQVFFPATGMFHTFRLSYLRISWDWVNGRWLTPPLAPPFAKSAEMNYKYQASRRDKEVTETEAAKVRENVVPKHSMRKDNLFERQKKIMRGEKATVQN